ncbi:SKP1-like protein 1A [Impatiens glandulifera]|uniref:SKP1-like protein 1A n=1 Tax=Impatiens glandulifera TaxID=253017 RepID=UPI001FB0BF7E|nr:SKP1-like protein 1A [Impatiens glandulifera]
MGLQDNGLIGCDFKRNTAEMLKLKLKLKSTSKPKFKSKSKSNKIVLKTSDNKRLTMKKTIANQSQTLKQMVKNDGANKVIHLSNITYKIMVKVKEYCNKHANDPLNSCFESTKEILVDQELKKFDSEFVQVDVETLFHLIMAARFLNIKNLLDLLCTAVANMIKENSIEELRKKLRIENDYTPEEEEEVRKEIGWPIE